QARLMKLSGASYQHSAIRTDTPITLYTRGPMIINLLATWIPAVLIAFLGVLKLTGNPRVVEEMSKVGVGRYLRLLGVMEIAFAALFVVPATMKRSFEGQSVYPVVLIWIGAFIRDRSIFF